MRKISFILLFLTACARPPAPPEATSVVPQAPVQAENAAVKTQDDVAEALLKLKDKVVRFRLDNGLTFLLYPGLTAPVFSAFIAVKVGSVDETPGITGLAHFFEHMAFKGTRSIGTKDYEAEKLLLDEIHKVGTQLIAARQRGESVAKLKQLQVRLEAFEKQAEHLVIKDEFFNTYLRNGAENLNATTSKDTTEYYVSLPANKLELWAYMESERLLHPAMRGFYSEKEVVLEERRMRIETSPPGKLYEEFLDTAYDQSPYGYPGIGFPEDVRDASFETARKFFETYYVPRNMVIAIVGHFDLSETQELLKKYFGRLPDHALPERRIAKEELTGFPKKSTIYDDAEPRLFLGYHRPTLPHPDEHVFDVIQSIMCGGRSSRLYSEAVKKQNIALGISCYAGFPGAREDNLFVFSASPLQGHSNDEIKALITDQINKIATEGVTSYELQKVLNELKAQAVWRLDDYQSMAQELAYFETIAGNYEYVIEVVDRIAHVTSDDVKRVAQTYFKPEREVYVTLERQPQDSGTQKGSPQ